MTAKSDLDQRQLDRVRLAALDAESRRWVAQLRVGHPRRDRTIANLHDVLRRVAWSELSRRRHQLGWVSGPEFEDLAQQAADDALVNVLDRLNEFRGLSRFTTWAYKFVMFGVSAKVARHAWRRHPPCVEELAWDQLPDRLAPGPEDQLHIAGPVDQGWRVITVWDSREDFDRFREEQLLPAIRELAGDEPPSVEPEVNPVHKLIQT